MFIDRGHHGTEADNWLAFCLDQLEKAGGFSRGIGWETDIAPGLTVEEVVGALVAAEDHIEGGLEHYGMEDVEFPELFGDAGYRASYRRGAADALAAIPELMRGKRDKRIVQLASRIAYRIMGAELEPSGFVRMVLSKASQRLHPAGPKKRFQVLKRDGYRCVLCGRAAGDGLSLEVDHIVPRSRGGSDEEDNLQTLCCECNRGKSDSPLEGSCSIDATP